MSKKKIVRPIEDRVPHLVISKGIHSRLLVLKGKMNESVAEPDREFKLGEVGARTIFIGLEALERLYGLYTEDIED